MQWAHYSLLIKTARFRIFDDFEGNIDRLVMDWNMDEVYASGLI